MNGFSGLNHYNPKVTPDGGAMLVGEQSMGSKSSTVKNEAELAEAAAVIEERKSMTEGTQKQSN